ncbi:LmeA family phospholipid-binding protein [Actinoplanes derwentensis]|uniref:LmeA family phospholipid-binding protein n=1 Tax=Actinoplanes derwentensis TaxID=113562 RepID=UPI0012FDCCB6|nr:DUF2993 domain-containing protein [Actinoplanes derwentensis]
MRKPLIIIGVTAGCLLTATVVADRAAASIAAGRLAAQVRCAAGLSSDPSVSFGGVPFLDQLARRRFDSVRLTADAVPAGRFRLSVEVDAAQVSLPATGTPSAESIRATITLPYGDLHAPAPTPSISPIAITATSASATSSRFPAAIPPVSSSSHSSLSSSSSAAASTSASAAPSPAVIPPSSGAADSGTVPGLLSGPLSTDGAGHLLIPMTRTILGRELQVTVIATPEITDGRLRIRPDEVELPVAGIRLPASRFGDGANAPTMDLPELPAGLAYTGAEAAITGLRLTITGDNVTADALTGDAVTAGAPTGGSSCSTEGGVAGRFGVGEGVGGGSGRYSGGAA